MGMHVLEKLSFTFLHFLEFAFVNSEYSSCCTSMGFYDNHPKSLHHYL